VRRLKHGQEVEDVQRLPERRDDVGAGRVRHGNSGGPAIDAHGRVQASVFAARIAASGGFATPSTIVASAHGARQEPVSTGSCAAG
jgi:hypothetical protein